MKTACAILALIPLIADCVTSRAAEVKTLNDVTYTSPGGVPVKLDAYLVKTEKPTPVLIFIHGGGWRKGDKKDLFEFLKEPLFDAAISIVSINYRLTDVAPYPAQVDDCTRAVQFVRNKAKEWNINPGCIALMGGSAGAHLSLWVGLHDDRKNPDSPDPVERQSSRVSCIVNYYGVTDFRPWHIFVMADDRLGILSKTGNLRGFMMFFGRKPDDPASSVPKSLVEDASPVTHVTPDDPPVFTAHGTGDTTCPCQQALTLISKLKKEGVESESHLLRGGNHGLSNPKPDWPNFRGDTIKFLKKHLLN